MAKKSGGQGNDKQVTRYTHDDVKEPRTPETGHTSLLPSDEQLVSVPMDNGWSRAITVGKLPADADAPPIVMDMDPDVDPVLFWSGKRNRRDVPVLPLQRNEVVTDSKIAQIVERARAAADREAQQPSLFHDLEKELREGDRKKRVEFYTHDEGWKNKLVCGNSLHVMESLRHYEGLSGRVQMVYMDPPYGIRYNSNFQQRVDTPHNDESDTADDVLTIKAFRDTWALRVHSYLSYLQETLYLCRDLLSETGSVFVQIGDENVHRARAVLDEVFGAANFVSTISFVRGGAQTSQLLASISDHLLWYAKDKNQIKYHQLYIKDGGWAARSQDLWQELPDGTRSRLRSSDDAEPGAVVFTHNKLESATGSEASRFAVEYAGRTFHPKRGWSTSPEGMERLKQLNRLLLIGNSLRFVVPLTDFPYSTLNNQWRDTYLSGFASNRLYAVQTSESVVERCIAMTSDPGDIVLDPTCGSGTTASCAERLGRRWVTCDTSRVAINVARQRILSSVFEHYKTQTEFVQGGFVYETAQRISMKSLANNLEPEQVDLFDRPAKDKQAIRVSGPFEVLTLGRYAVDDWRGYVADSGRLENYIEVVCRLYRQDAAVQGASGLVHAIAESETDKVAISVGPVTGRVTAKQISDAVQDAMSMGILEVHVLGWAFEANVGEVKSQLESRGRVKVVLQMIRPDTLSEGLKVTQPDMLFSPLALPDVDIRQTKTKGGGRECTVTLKGVGVFNREKRETRYYHANDGYVAAWYLDEDYDGDCFVDCQMFFDFSRKPNLEATLKVEIDSDEFELQLTSQPFEPGRYTRIAVKAVDVYGNESTVVKSLE